MHVSQLELSNVRSFRRLELGLSPGIHLIFGANASGKTNLLEAIAMLATTRGVRGGTDGELIAWDALRDDPLPAARLAAQVESAAGRTSIEITVIARAGSAVSADAPTASRRFRVNGVARRASDLIGRLRVVMFSADDIAIVDGPPSGRRRFLDITLSQLDGRYVRALQRYGRVIQQRNSLLRQFQGRRHDPGELEFWDRELAAAGAVVLGGRARLLCDLGAEAAARHAELSTGAAPLEVVYRPAVPDDLDVSQPEEALETALRDALERGRANDVRRGATQVGPHRDDVAFLLGGHDAGAYASRGEQRTVALALRLAEVALSTSRTGDPPLLLLDDILSELDEERRARVIHAAYGVDQVLITTPDADRPTVEELPGARRYRLAEGVLSPLDG